VKGVVLIVDDSLTVRMDLIETFLEAGLPAIGCDTVAAARTALAQEAVSLAILDVVLPDGDGVELVREIRSAAATAGLPILMLSSEAEVRDRIRGLAMGSNDYVGKPYDRDYVLARARELLQRGQTTPVTRPTVLVIDDSPTFREELCQALLEHGYDSIVAASGEEGLRAAASHRPTAVVVDGVLPGIDGATVVRKLRLDVALRHTPCVLLTDSSSDLSVELAALDAGADSFVRKEEDMSVILARVAAVLRAGADTTADRDTASLLGPKKILAVDSSVEFLEALTVTLGGEGFDLITARSGEDALEMLGVQVVDCILLDLTLPGLSGIDTCQRIKQSPATRDISLIMLTAADDRDAMITSLRAGADDYVLKSGEPEVLKARLRAQLRRKQFEDEGRHLRLQMLRKELEAAEARAAQELAATKAAAVEELERKNRELELATHAKGQFLSTMSHEIRTPMNAIIGMAGLLDDTPLSEQQREYTSIIRTSGEHLLLIINDILDFSALESDKLALENAPYRVTAVVEDCLNLLSEKARGKGLKLIHEVAVDVPAVLLGDMGRLRQILLNYLSNALKFTATGEIRVRVSSAAVADSMQQLHFAVCDTGMGIPAERFDRLFHSFSQVDASTHRQFGGTGLGLAICKRLAELMGGRVWAESRVGEGSTFHFSVRAGVPAQNTTALPQSESLTRSDQLPELARLNPLRILVAEDNPVNVRLVTILMQRMGYGVDVVGNGEEAIEALRRQAYDVILMDVHMPKMDGIEATRRICDDWPAAKRPRIIALTAAVMPEERQACRDAGMDDFVVKPIDRAMLAAALAQCRRLAQSTDSAATG
jgi:DNA-binding response OmpR family regulator